MIRLRRSVFAAAACLLAFAAAWTPAAGAASSVRAGGAPGFAPVAVGAELPDRPAGVLPAGLLVVGGEAIGFAPNGYVVETANIVAHAWAGSNPAAQDFALFQTHDPWSATLIKDAITGAGRTFSVFAPAQLAGFPFEDFRVVVLNWDDHFLSDFAAAYTVALPDLEAYVISGGVLWLQGAIQGVAGDSYPLPFGGTADYQTASTNFIVDLDHAMMTGLSNPVVGDAASHTVLNGYPAAAHVVKRAVDAGGAATLYEMAHGLSILLAAADSAGFPAALQDSVQSKPGVGVVDVFDATGATPSLARLAHYVVVAPWSNSPFADPIAIGDNLADYVDAGGRVVQMGFSFVGPDQIYGINGRWVADGYHPYLYSMNLVLNAPFGLGTFDAADPLMAGVAALDSNFQNDVDPGPAAIELAAADNGNSLVAKLELPDNVVVGVTAYVGDDATWGGDFAQILVNAGRVLFVDGFETGDVSRWTFSTP